MDSSGEQHSQSEAGMVRKRGITYYAEGFGLSKEQFLSELMGDGKDRTILDVGSGEGEFVNEIKQKGKTSSLHIVGFDRRPKQGTSNAIYADFANQPFSSGSIDLALAACTLGYYAENEAELAIHFKELNRVLKDNGKALVILNPVTTMRAYGDETHPSVIESNKLALNASQFMIQRPSKYDKRHTDSDSSFNVDILSLIGKSGFNIAQKRMSQPGLGTGGLVCVELTKTPQQKKPV